FVRLLGRCPRLAMKLRLWRNQSIRVSKKAPLLADQNQNAGHQRQDAGHDHGDTDVKESHDSNKDQIDGEQQHSEIFGDVHEYFLSQPPSFCTHKIWSRESKICPRMDANYTNDFLCSDFSRLFVCLVGDIQHSRVADTSQ